jgi:hypothetical protein
VGLVLATEGCTSPEVLTSGDEKGIQISLKQDATALFICASVPEKFA